MNDFFGIVRKFLLEYLPLQRRFSENTVKSYRQGLNLYVSYLREVMQIPTNRIAFKDCSRDSVLGYLDWLGTERGRGATSVNQRLMVLRSSILSAEYDVEVAKRVYAEERVEEKAMEYAFEMLQDGVPSVKVAKYTKLPLEVVEGIRLQAR